METNHVKPHLKTVVEQTLHNTTSWIGQLRGETDNRIAGQTFICPAECDLETIEILPTIITNNGPVEMTLHSFDPQYKTWSPVIGSSQIEINRYDSGKWLSFPLNKLNFHLKKGMSYGFRLHSNAGLIGVGEAAAIHNLKPINVGQEWAASTDDESGHYYSHLSLTFKVQLRA